MITLTYQYWQFLGIITLLALTIQDYINNNKVDERKNYFMLGVTFGLLAIKPAPLLIFLFYIGFVFAFNMIMPKFKQIGKADITALSWILLGFLIMGYTELFIFLIAFLVVMVIYMIVRVIFKINYNTPFFGVLTIIFVLTCVINSFI